MQKRALIAMQYSALHHRTWITPTVQKPCNHGLQNKKAMKSFDFTAFFGAMEGTRTPGLLIRSQSLYPAELPTHTFRSEQDVFYHGTTVLSTSFLKFFWIFRKRTSFWKNSPGPVPALPATPAETLCQNRDPARPEPSGRCRLHGSGRSDTRSAAKKDKNGRFSIFPYIVFVIVVL